jgi:hypothetical protein
MNRLHQLIAQASLCVVGALALAGAFHFWKTIDQENRYLQDPLMTYQIGIQENRFRGVAAMVPAETVVAYLSDLPPQRAAHWPVNSEFIFTAVRYALAPRLLIPYEKGQRQDWVLGDFSNPADAARIERENGLKLIKDFGSGVMLFRSE